MHLEALEGHDRGAGPLPDVADHVVEVALRIGIDRHARGPVFQIDVARRPPPIRLIGGDCRRERVPQRIPVSLGRQLDVLAGTGGEPRTIRLRFQAVHLDRPVERQRHLVEQVPLPKGCCRFRAPPQPEPGVFGPRVVQPAAALLRPPLLTVIATILDKGEKFTVGDQLTGSPKIGQDDLFHPVFIVPAECLIVGRLAQPHCLRCDGQPVVGGHWAGAFADRPELALLGREFASLPQIVKRHQPHDHARRLQVDPLMLDTHQDDPGG